MKKEIIACLLVLLIFASGCTAAKSQVVKEGDTVLVNYKGTFDNGSIFDNSEGRSPLEFIAGAGQMIKGFDNAVIGMRVNETKKIRLDPKDAYGEKSPNLLQNVTRNNFGNETIPTIGMKIYDSIGRSAKIIEIWNDGNITIDFNHELAGIPLNFDITLVEIR